MYLSWLQALTDGRLALTPVISVTVIVLLLLPPARAYFRQK
ncbi:hypothetical protein [Longispora albida]|nr:hypothetical protein [Longispora albida]